MSHLFIFLLMICAGAMIAVQPAINSRLAQKVGLIEAACFSFAVGTAVLLTLALLTSQGNWRGAGQAHWWEWTGGLFGAFFVTAAIFAVPRIGTAATMAAVIAAQLTTALILDHFGVFGLREIPFDLKRLAGTALLFAGAWLIFRP